MNILAVSLFFQSALKIAFASFIVNASLGPELFIKGFIPLSGEAIKISSVNATSVIIFKTAKISFTVLNDIFFLLIKRI